MSSSTAKRLILYRFDRQPVEALVHADAYFLDAGIELMFLDGNLQVIDYNSVKALCFAAEGAPADLFTAQTSFERRPKTPGLWASFRLRDDDVLEGVLPHNMLEWPSARLFSYPAPLQYIPPARFPARQAIRETALWVWWARPLPLESKMAKKAEVDGARQLSMFD